MKIRCKTCGLEREAFHGWVFAMGKCRQESKPEPTILHNWERVDEEAN